MKALKPLTICLACAGAAIWQVKAGDRSTASGHVAFTPQGGGQFPAMVYGTAGIKDADTILSALKAGYRHIDTALLYGSHAAVREALNRSKLSREDVFLTTKVSFLPGGLSAPWRWLLDNVADYGSGTSALLGKGSEREALQRSLRELGIAQADLCLIHLPFASGMSEFLAAYLPHRLGRHKPLAWSWLRPLAGPLRRLMRLAVEAVGADHVAAADARRAAWQQLEAAWVAGECRHIGVSNYDAGLLRELEATAHVMPAVNQLEMHPRFQARETMTYCKDRGIAVMAYGNSVSMRHEVATAIASQKGLQAAQVTLHWTLQQGVAAVATSSRREGMAQNLAALDFALTAGEMKALDALDERQPFFWDASARAMPPQEGVPSKAGADL
mmetsp:Transcript_64593/g.114918  ORF Transcript_64593/g.114918 Transcript_64593/m.114918 type:complete len:386 (+) Transcript_64593:177-1334(+)